MSDSRKSRKPNQTDGSQINVKSVLALEINLRRLTSRSATTNDDDEVPLTLSGRLISTHIQRTNFRTLWMTLRIIQPELSVSIRAIRPERVRLRDSPPVDLHYLKFLTPSAVCWRWRARRCGNCRREYLHVEVLWSLELCTDLRLVPGEGNMWSCFSSPFFAPTSSGNLLTFNKEEEEEASIS